MMTRRTRILEDIMHKLDRIEREAELTRSILIVKEPDTATAAEAYDGLRKQVVASTSARRTHLVQLVAMAVALGRANSLADVLPQVRQWMKQAGVVELFTVPPGMHAQDLFEDMEREGLSHTTEIEVLEPAYIDEATGAVLRLGRARQTTGLPQGRGAPGPDRTESHFARVDKSPEPGEGTEG